MNTYIQTILIAGVISVFSLVHLTTSVSALDEDMIMELQNRMVLRGLKSVALFVEQLNPQIEEDGLSAATLKTDTEIKLQRAGIKVLSREESYRTQGSAGLFLKAHVFRYNSAGYVYNVSLSLKEEAHLSRVNYLAPLATTWESELSLGVTPDISEIRATAKGLVDEFVDMYLAANSK